MGSCCQEKAASTSAAKVSGSPEIADIICEFEEDYRLTHAMTSAQRNALWSIKACRTPALGGRVEKCDCCGATQALWNSCNNPHCPKCGSMKRAGWLESMKSVLLPCGYFHVVFTLDHSLLPIFQGQVEAAGALLFSAASDTLKTFAAKQGGVLGFTAVLHTWDQQLKRHPHLHCLIPAGMLSADHEKWIPFKNGFLFPVKALSKVFRAKLLDQLATLIQKGKLELKGDMSPRLAADLIAQSKRKSWVVFAQPPLGGPESVLKYLARYAYRVAISNERIVSVDENTVTFKVKDRKHDNATKLVTISGEEFVRRFFLHILPPGFRRIRHFGFIANASRRKLLSRCFKLLGKSRPSKPSKKSARTLMLELTGVDICCCQSCGKGTMVTLHRFQAGETGTELASAPQWMDSS